MTRPTRRVLLAGLGATFGAGLALPRRGWALAGPPLSFGDITVRVFSDGDRTLPLATLFAGIARSEIDAAYAAAGLGAAPDEVPTPNNVTLIETPGRRILIDAGGGPNWSATTGQLEQALWDEGIAPEDVTDLLFTHAHPDHLWGALDDFEELPRFPSARHLITLAERDYWTAYAPTGDGFRDGMALGAQRVMADLGDALEIVAPEAEIAPGIRLLPTPGHTPGHVSVLIDAGGASVLILGDALTNPVLSFAHPDWPLATDSDPAMGAATRARLLDRCAADALPVIGYHLPFPGHGRVERANGAYRFVPA
jgi:glyoxylase-like metal-dependent hydrolase (beta-lactamase superfamily II)